MSNIFSHRTTNQMPQALAKTKRMVVKIGSSLLIKDGMLDTAWIGELAKDIADATAHGIEVVIVSSGAIALGRARLKLSETARALDMSQAAAAAGQIALARGWESSLETAGLAVAQILITREDTEQRRRYLNARRTIEALLKLSVIPIINENDTVATQEIRAGDNDRLAAQVASMISADCLLLLSDIDGLYQTAPHADTPASGHVAQVTAITPEILAMAKDTINPHGRGGMVTKLAAAEIAGAAGCHMVLASGREMRPLKGLSKGARCTFFQAQATPRSARKNWIASKLTPAGLLHIDEGAMLALSRGKSLLPIGVVRIEGDFDRGDSVVILAPDGQEIARGLSAYDAQDATRIIGHHSAEIEDLLGFRGALEIIHRDDLVMRHVMRNRANTI